MTTAFVPRDSGDVAKLVQAYPLCWVISGGTADRLATPLPLLAETDGQGRVVSLLGHMGRANPQHEALAVNPRATILSMGPQGYISPRLVSNLTWGPTWNYAACRFEADVHFVPEETGEAVWKLAEALEGGAKDSWTPRRMGKRYEELKQRIIAFRAVVLETHPRFKLGQDETDAVFSEIVEGLENRGLADWMVRTRR
jgi:transcriptional regulator